MKKVSRQSNCRPLVVLGKTGTLSAAFSRICEERNINYVLLSRNDLDIADTDSLEQVMNELNPWGIVNAAGYLNVNKTEATEETCMQVNANGPAALAALCYHRGIRFLSYSSSHVFDGAKTDPYVESDAVSPLNDYGRSKVMAEKVIFYHNPNALIVRTSNFFSPWDRDNFVHAALRNLKEGKEIVAANDVMISPTYVPDLVHASLDLMLDNEEGIVHIANKGAISWADFAKQIAIMIGANEDLVNAVPQQEMQLQALQPSYSVLKSERGIVLPELYNALERYLETTGVEYQSGKIAV